MKTVTASTDPSFEVTIWPLLSRPMTIWIALIIVVALAALLGVGGLNWNERINLSTTLLAIAACLGLLFGHRVHAAFRRSGDDWQLVLRSGTLRLAPLVTLPIAELQALTVSQRYRKRRPSAREDVLMIERRSGPQIFVAQVRTVQARSQWLALSDHMKRL